MTTPTIEDYLMEASRLAVKQEMTALLKLIDAQKNEAGMQSLEEFYKGEYAFYSGNYESALKHYLQSSAVPQFYFFCFRASAYLFHDLGNLEKAAEFAYKALKIVPDDPMTQAILDKTLPSKASPAEFAQIVEQQPEEDIFLASANQINTNNPVSTMESPMNTESDIFSSPKSQESGVTQALTQRLYSTNQGTKENDPFTKTLKPGSTAFDELKKLALSPAEQQTDMSGTQVLEQRIKNFQHSHIESTRQYLEKAKQRPIQPDYCLYYLNGWPQPNTQWMPYLTEQSRRATGGIFLRWNGKGIAINPGGCFLKHFHAQGLSLRDIDAVIVTSDLPETHVNVKQIYDLCYQLNRVSSELHIIDYYFNYSAFQDLSKILKPHFKQERDTLHSLEMFIDSPDVEKIDLFDGITLHYFLASGEDSFASKRESKEETSGLDHSSLGIRLELKSSSALPQERPSIRIGYISHAAWNPLLAHHLGHCDMLITGFGNTSANDINRFSYNSECLGYYGIYTLLEEVTPRLLLCGEFGGREGDIRLETAQKLRQDYTSTSNRSQRNAPVVLPADIGLQINLKTLQLKCSVSGAWVDPAQARATKTANHFGKLEYLSPNCCY